jgi:hypothetical protein
MCDEETKTLLEHILYTLESDSYEISDPFTMGGGAGIYQIRNPYNTECEWAIVSATSGTTAGQFVVMSKNPTPATLGFAGADSLALQSGGMDNNPLNAYVGALTTQAPFVTYQEEFMPLAGNGMVFLRVTAAGSNEVLVTIRFRRKLERYIQEIPAQKPHTHVPLSARNARTFMQGFRDDSKRMGVPINPKPDEDTSLIAGGRSGSTGKVGLAPVPRAPLNALQKLNERVVPKPARAVRGKRVS